ncbi:MAG: hypothetical protein JNK47_12835 [Mesorhizobium sp.]|nr:hypothetical protein [Mesorhizobium sp.]MBL8578105.1 hypothetical protein [Mesorhizobium sp.]
MTDLSNSLADLAERVREANEAGAAAERTAAEKMLNAGRLLCQAKDACQHGEWMPFLVRAGVHDRQARRLMQIARSGLTSDTVTELGGFKATLQWLAAWKMPAADEVVFIVRGEDREHQDSIACVLPSEVDGHYDVTLIGRDGCYFTTQKPLASDPVFIDGRFLNAVLETIAKGFDVPLAEWSISSAPIYLLLDDCEFLNGLISAPADGKAPLPHSYQHMVETLEACDRDFSRENYLRARRAQVLCLSQMDRWPHDPRMMQTLARISNDGNRVGKLAAKIDLMADQNLRAEYVG